MSGVTASGFDTTGGGPVTFSLHRARPRLGPAGRPCGARPLCGATTRRASNEGRKAGVRARPLLENSTACRKSVPSNFPSWGLSGFWVGFFGLIDIAICQVAVLSWFQIIYGEFDPGSGRTLAACLTHASRTVNLLRWGISGERVSNTWATCPRLWDNSKKLGLIPDMTADRMVWWWKVFRLGMGPRPISLLVR